MAIKRKTRIGQVVSNKMDKTVVVGDIVRIMETRPLSKEKRWRVAEIIDKKGVVEVKPGDIT